MNDYTREQIAEMCDLARQFPLGRSTRGAHELALAVADAGGYLAVTGGRVVVVDLHPVPWGIRMQLKMHGRAAAEYFGARGSEVTP